MPYEQEISRANKALFVFLLDQSYSMEEPLGNSQNKKKDELVTAINGWLQNMIIRATGGEGVRDWMDVAVIGYRTDQDANAIVESPLSGALAGREIVSISELNDNPSRIESRTRKVFDEDVGGVVKMQVDVPVWVEPVAEGGTPMCNALYQVHQLVERWAEEHKSSFPPVIIHITDGESQDGDPTEYAESLREVETDDGAALLFNCHLSMTKADSFMFPHSDEILPDKLARVLFHMSSELPESMFNLAKAEGFEHIETGARGMAFNADMVELIKFLDMGTRAAPTLR